MPLPLFAWIAGGLLVAAVVTCWDEIKEWLVEAVSAIKRFFVGMLHATAAFIKKARATIAKIMHSVYYKEDDKWIEETTTREIPESELPPSVRRKLTTKKKEVTEELEELGLEV